MAALVCGGVLGQLDSNRLCCECRNATLGLGGSGRLLGTFESNCTMNELRALEAESIIAKVKVRADKLEALNETEENCGTPACCLETVGIVADAAHSNESAQLQQDQRVCTHSVAGCSDDCLSIARFAFDNNVPVDGNPATSIVSIVLPCIVIALAIAVMMFVQSKGDSADTVEITIDGPKSLFKQTEGSEQRNLGSSFKRKNPLVTSSWHEKTSSDDTGGSPASQVDSGDPKAGGGGGAVEDCFGLSDVAVPASPVIRVYSEPGRLDSSTVFFGDAVADGGYLDLNGVSTGGDVHGLSVTKLHVLNRSATSLIVPTQRSGTSNNQNFLPWRSVSDEGCPSVHSMNEMVNFDNTLIPSTHERASVPIRRSMSDPADGRNPSEKHRISAV